MNATCSTDYQTLMSRAGLVDCAHRTKLEIAGDDRKEFLHGLCTNDIRKLADGAGCEAFITTMQGKILGYVTVFSGPQSLVLDTVPGQGEKLFRHCDKYLIRQKVELIDHSAEWSSWLLAGPLSTSILQSLGVATGQVPTGINDSRSISLAGVPCWLRRVDWLAVDAYLIDSLVADYAALGQAIEAAGVPVVDHAAFDIARIEHGTPEFGMDITEQNLPQEIARDARTISFTKGCYLGQETVARIDALGHVNRYLVQVLFDGSDVPPRGTKISLAGKEVGEVTSGCFSPQHERPLALAFIRRGHHASGTRLDGCVVL